MLDNRVPQALALFSALVLGVTAVSADERVPAAGSTAPRSYAPRPVQAVRAATAQSHARQEPNAAAARPAPVQMAQIDSHGRYPFGQFRGGYRYPFSYPYYRYGGPRHFPYSFGVGPYGPYGSNYGGYSGNAYDPYVYGRPLPNGPSVPDAPPAAPPADSEPPASVKPPVDRAPQADHGPQSNSPQSNPADAEVAPGPSLLALPVPTETQAYGGPPAYVTRNPLGLIYGSAPAYGTYPFGFYNNAWFGQNPLIGGFGVFQPQLYGDPYEPPYGPGFYRPAYLPQYAGFNGRNYGPTYPSAGGINPGTAYYYGR